MPEPLELHLALPSGAARDAVASALTEQGFTVKPTPTGSLDASRGSLGTTLVAGAFAGQDMHVRFDVFLRDVPEGAVATFSHSAAGGFFKGGAVGAVKAGDVVREAAHLSGVRLSQQGLIAGAVPADPSRDTESEAATPSSLPGAPASAGATPVPAPVDYANRTNVVAIVAIVLGFVVPIGGIIAGAVGLAQVKRTGEKGRGLAIAGIVVGSVMTVVYTLAVIAFVAFFVVAGVAESAAASRDETAPGGAAVPGDGGLIDPTDDVPTDVFSLQVGQCLDEIATGYITSDDVIGCETPHTYEVYGDVTVPDGTFPGDDQLASTAEQSCGEAFASFVGLSYDESALQYTYVTPTSDTWEWGDRQIVCLITDPAGETTGSLAGSAR